MIFSSCRPKRPLHLKLKKKFINCTIMHLHKSFLVCSGDRSCCDYSKRYLADKHNIFDVQRLSNTYHLHAKIGQDAFKTHLCRVLIKGSNCCHFIKNLDFHLPNLSSSFAILVSNDCTRLTRSFSCSSSFPFPVLLPPLPGGSN